MAVEQASSENNHSTSRSPSQPGRRPSEQSSTQYGTINGSVSHAAAKPPRKPSRSLRAPKEPARPQPNGPLSRVPSHGTFVPIMALDLDAVAHEVSESVGGVYTTQDLLSSLAENGPTEARPHDASEDIAQTYPPRKDQDAQGDGDVWKTGQPRQEGEHAPPLEVVMSEQESGEFPGEALVLKIRPPEYDGRSGSVDPQASQGMESMVSESAHGGFAINVPVSKERDPFDQDISASWEPHSIFNPESYEDLENPLISQDDGIDLTARTAAESMDDGNAAFVQRSGRRDVASEQEVTYAVPNPEGLGTGTTGLLLPVVDSKNDLRQLVFVVPPEQGTEKDEETPLVGDSVAEHPFTAEATREYLETLASKIPPIVDVESTLEVHGTARNATVAMSVTQEVSWVGYLVLAIALLSVASQGTAVKWLANVDGLIAASWLMQAQTCIMIPLAAFQYFTLNQEEYKVFWNPATLRQLAATSVAQVLWGSGFFLAIDYTSLFHAWSLNNIHSVVIVLFCMLQKIYYRGKAKDVSQGEVRGAKFALLGVALMQIPTFLSGNISAFAGDFIAICSSISALIFLNLCKDLRNKVPLYLMMGPITAMNSILFSVGSMVIKGSDFSFTDHGALGWLRADRIGLGLYLGGVVGFLGTICCIAALKFLPSVVVGSVQTMMPVAGTLLAVLIGVDELPDFWTTLGGAVLMFGVLCIADATRRSEHTVVLNSHISEAGVA